MPWIDFHSSYSTKLCGEPAATAEAISIAFVGVARFDDPLTNEANWMWAQTGYMRWRNPGGIVITPQVYAETKYLGPIVPGVNPNLQVREFPTTGFHTYACYQFSPATGKWSYRYDDASEWAQFPHQDWVGVKGNVYSWSTEIHNKDDDMVGVFGNECKFRNCEYQVNWMDAWIAANIQQPDLHSDDHAEWIIDLGAIQTEFQIYDPSPNP